MRLTSEALFTYTNTWFALSCEVSSMYSGGPLQLTVESYQVTFDQDKNIIHFENANVTSNISQIGVVEEEIILTRLESKIVENPISYFDVSFGKAGQYLISCTAPYRYSTTGQLGKYWLHTVIGEFTLSCH